MLVISRRVGEELHIGDDIVVRIVRIGPHAFRVGITAPKHVNVRRDDIAQHDDEDAEQQ